VYGSSGEGASYARRVAGALVAYRTGAYSQDYRNVPDFSVDPAAYESARQHLAVFIERVRAGLSDVLATGTVVDAATGRPVVGATVSDGLLAAKTAADGSYHLSGVLPECDLTVTHPKYQSAGLHAREGDPPARVALTRVQPFRPLAAFERLRRFRLPGGVASLSAKHVTGGRRSLRLDFRVSGDEAVWRVPPRFRDLRDVSRLELDVYDPAAVDRLRPWFLTLTIMDLLGRESHQRFLLAPRGWTHLSLPLTGHAFDRRRTFLVSLRVSPPGRHIVYVDSLFAK
jgi:hypothetical protein